MTSVTSRSNSPTTVSSQGRLSPFLAGEGNPPPLRHSNASDLSDLSTRSSRRRSVDRLQSSTFNSRRRSVSPATSSAPTSRRASNASASSIKSGIIDPDSRGKASEPSPRTLSFQGRRYSDASDLSARSRSQTSRRGSTASSTGSIEPNSRRGSVDTATEALSRRSSYSGRSVSSRRPSESSAGSSRSSSRGELKPRKPSVSSVASSPYLSEGGSEVSGSQSRRSSLKSGSKAKELSYRQSTFNSRRRSAELTPAQHPSGRRISIVVIPPDTSGDAGGHYPAASGRRLSIEVEPPEDFSTNDAGGRPVSAGFLGPSPRNRQLKPGSRSRERRTSLDEEPVAPLVVSASGLTRAVAEALEVLHGMLLEVKVNEDQNELLGLFVRHQDTMPEGAGSVSQSRPRNSEGKMESRLSRSEFRNALASISDSQEVCDAIFETYNIEGYVIFRGFVEKLATDLGTEETFESPIEELKLLGDKAAEIRTQKLHMLALQNLFNAIERCRHRIGPTSELDNPSLRLILSDPLKEMLARSQTADKILLQKLITGLDVPDEALAGVDTFLKSMVDVAVKELEVSGDAGVPLSATWRKWKEVTADLNQLRIMQTEYEAKIKRMRERLDRAEDQAHDKALPSETRMGALEEAQRFQEQIENLQAGEEKELTDLKAKTTPHPTKEPLLLSMNCFEIVRKVILKNPQYLDACREGIRPCIAEVKEKRKYIYKELHALKLKEQELKDRPTRLIQEMSDLREQMDSDEYSAGAMHLVTRMDEMSKQLKSYTTNLPVEMQAIEARRDQLRFTPQEEKVWRIIRQDYIQRWERLKKKLSAVCRLRIMKARRNLVAAKRLSVAYEEGETWYPNKVSLGLEPVKTYVELDGEDKILQSAIQSLKEACQNETKRKTLETAFQDNDWNGYGLLMVDEWIHALHVAGICSHEDVSETLFQALDVDRNGLLAWQNVILGLTRPEGEQDPHRIPTLSMRPSPQTVTAADVLSQTLDIEDHLRKILKQKRAWTALIDACGEYSKENTMDVDALVRALKDLGLSTGEETAQSMALIFKANPDDDRRGSTYSTSSTSDPPPKSESSSSAPKWALEVFGLMENMMMCEHATCQEPLHVRRAKTRQARAQKEEERRQEFETLLPRKIAQAAATVLKLTRKQSLLERGKVDVPEELKGHLAVETKKMHELNVVKAKLEQQMSELTILDHNTVLLLRGLRQLEVVAEMLKSSMTFHRCLSRWHQRQDNRDTGHDQEHSIFGSGEIKQRLIHQQRDAIGRTLRVEWLKGLRDVVKDRVEHHNAEAASKREASLEQRMEIVEKAGAWALILEVLQKESYVADTPQKATWVPGGMQKIMTRTIIDRSKALLTRMGVTRGGGNKGSGPESNSEDSTTGDSDHKPNPSGPISGAPFRIWRTKLLLSKALNMAIGGEVEEEVPREKATRDDINKGWQALVAAIQALNESKKVSVAPMIDKAAEQLVSKSFLEKQSQAFARHAGDDQQLQPEEFAPLVQKILKKVTGHPVTSTDVTQAFKEFDADDSGALDAKEYEVFLSWIALETCKRVFSECVGSGGMDGQIEAMKGLAQKLKWERIVTPGQAVIGWEFSDLLRGEWEKVWHANTTPEEKGWEHDGVGMGQYIPSIQREEPSQPVEPLVPGEGASSEADPLVIIREMGRVPVPPPGRRRKRPSESTSRSFVSRPRDSRADAFEHLTASAHAHLHNHHTHRHGRAKPDVSYTRAPYPPQKPQGGIGIEPRGSMPPHTSPNPRAHRLPQMEAYPARAQSQQRDIDRLREMERAIERRNRDFKRVPNRLEPIGSDSVPHTHYPPRMDNLELRRLPSDYQGQTPQPPVRIPKSDAQSSATSRATRPPFVPGGIAVPAGLKPHDTTACPCRENKPCAALQGECAEHFTDASAQFFQAFGL